MSLSRLMSPVGYSSMSLSQLMSPVGYSSMSLSRFISPVGFTTSTQVVVICRLRRLLSAIQGCPIINFFGGQFLFCDPSLPSPPSFVVRGIISTSTRCRLLIVNRSCAVMTAGLPVPSTISLQCTIANSRQYAMLLSWWRPSPVVVGRRIRGLIGVSPQETSSPSARTDWQFLSNTRIHVRMDQGTSCVSQLAPQKARVLLVAEGRCWKVFSSALA